MALMCRHLLLKIKDNYCAPSKYIKLRYKQSKFYDIFSLTSLLSLYIHCNNPGI